MRKGAAGLPDHTWDSAPRFDVLVYPGGVGTRRELADPETLERLRALSEAGTLMTSVCTGSLVFAAAGLLRDRPATTWWGRLDTLVELDPTIEARPDDRFVDSGEVVTAAGVSAGIDMALHLVARLHSAIARATCAVTSSTTLSSGSQAEFRRAKSRARLPRLWRGTSLKASAFAAASASDHPGAAAQRRHGVAVAGEAVDVQLGRADHEVDVDLRSG